MRIAFLAPAFPPVPGGAETYAQNVVVRLARRGHEVQVVTDAVPGRPAGVSEVDGVRVVSLDRYRERLSAVDLIAWEQMSFGLLPDLDAHLTGPHRPDVIHANSHDTAITGSMAALSLGVPLVCSPHELSPETAELGVGRSRLVYRHLPVDRFIVGSRFYLDKARAWGATDDRIALAYYGVDVDRFQHVDGSALRAELGYRPNNYLLVCVARLKERKGILELVRAIAVLVKERGWYDLRAALVGTVSSGSVEYAEKVRAEIDGLGLSKVVRIVDDLRYDDMPPLMRAADVVVQPSHAEGLGLTLLESMAAGTPVVGTDVVGIQEVLEDGENGLLVPARDHYALAMALQRMRTESGLATRLAANAGRTVRARFSLAAQAEQTEAVYREVIAEAAGRGSGTPVGTG